MKAITDDEARSVKTTLDKIHGEISRAIVGHRQVIQDVLVCLLCGGHALLEGVPGLGKTYLIKTLGEVLELRTSRIQFTPDLMPADIIGTNVLVQGKKENQQISFQKGPIFANLLLADEINRATPKTQSALLEAMQEKGVTVGGERYPLEAPFMVLATQNPIEMEGTYPLPEAQLDRFFFKLKIEYPTREDLDVIVDRTTRSEEPAVDKIVSAGDIVMLQKMVRDVPVPHEVKQYAIDIVLHTHPDNGIKEVKQYVRYGSSPRGVQSLVLAGKVLALIDGRFNVDFRDIRGAAYPSLRHRLILSFEGEAEGIETEEIIRKILEEVKERPA